MTEENVHSFLNRRERELIDKIEFTTERLAMLNAELDDVKRAIAALRSPPPKVIPKSILIDDQAIRANIAEMDAATRAAKRHMEDFIGDQLKAASVLSQADLDGMMKAAIQFTVGHVSTQKPANPTIKELVVSSLDTKPDFRERGATVAELREYIKTIYGRDIERSSLSPQLSRLQRDGFIEAGEEGRWKAAVGHKMLRQPSLLARDEAPSEEDSDGAQGSSDVGK